MKSKIVRVLMFSKILQVDKYKKEIIVTKFIRSLPRVNTFLKKEQILTYSSKKCWPRQSLF